MSCGSAIKTLVVRLTLGWWAGVLAIGCSAADRAMDPVRVLCPAIRTADLVRWCNDSGESPSSTQWRAIDAIHEQYLERTVDLRCPARERLTELFSNLDSAPAPELALELRTQRAALAVNRDFNAQLASLDDSFFGQLTAANLLTPATSRAFAARRRLERISQLFARASASLVFVLDGHPDPCDLVLSSWPTSAPRDRDAINAWTTGCADQLHAAAEARWDLRRSARADFLAASLAPTDPTSSNDADTQVKIAQTRFIERERLAALDWARACRGALQERSAGIPAAAYDEAMRHLCGRFGDTRYARGLQRAYQTATRLAGPDRHRVERIERDRAAWRAQQFAQFEQGELDLARVERECNANLSALLAHTPDQESKDQITRAFNHEPPPGEGIAIDFPESDGFDEETKKYHNLYRAGLITSPPPRHFLHTIARLAHLDEEQEELFASDAHDQWQALMVSENQRIWRVEQSFQEKALEEAIRDPAQLTRTIAHVMAECITAPLAASDALDARLCQTLIDRAQAFGGTPEPAATLWRVLRALPPNVWRADGIAEPPHVTMDDFRMFFASAPASVAVLACDSTLSPLARQVLVDLIVRHKDALIRCAAEVREARAAALPSLARALVAMQRDQLEGKRELLAALRIFRAATDRFDQVQQSIVDEAAAILPGADGHRLRCQRAQRLLPEFFVPFSSLFAGDGAKARTSAGDALDAADGALRVQLERDDLALSASVHEAIARGLDGQPNSTQLDDLYRRDERLAEQSLRRIDRAARAARDLKP